MNWEKIGKLEGKVEDRYYYISFFTFIKILKIKMKILE